jgi:hypothetical protein
VAVAVKNNNERNIIMVDCVMVLEFFEQFAEKRDG